MPQKVWEVLWFEGGCLLGSWRCETEPATKEGTVFVRPVGTSQTIKLRGGAVAFYPVDSDSQLAVSPPGFRLGPARSKR